MTLGKLRYLLLGTVLVAFASQAADPWVVRNFRVVGAQRIAEGTVYNYLPINVGDTVTDQRIQEAVRAVYSTGFFRDVELRREGDTLVIALLERPSIEDFTIEGNEVIETEALETSLLVLKFATYAALYFGLLILLWDAFDANSASGIWESFVYDLFWVAVYPGILFGLRTLVQVVADRPAV